MPLVNTIYEISKDHSIVKIPTGRCYILICSFYRIRSIAIESEEEDVPKQLICDILLATVLAYSSNA